MVVAGLLAPAALVVAGGWSAHLGLRVRDHLDATRAALVQLRAAVAAGDLSPVSPVLAEARRHAAEARRLTEGPDWWVLAHTPVVGDAATTVRGLAWAAAELTEAFSGVQRAGTPLMTISTPSLVDMGRQLAALDAAAPALDEAATRLRRADSRLAATPAVTGVRQVDEARGTALAEIGRLRDLVRDAADTAALLPPMLGRDGPRRYFLAFQTNAEARGTGGLVGAFGILKADRGRISIERLSVNNGLTNSPVPVVDHGTAYRERYGASATRMLSISNLSPHFPYAAATWTRLWERQHGRRLDGALATDPVGLAHLLKIIGPVTLPGGEKVTPANVVDLTEREAYARYTDPAARKRFLLRVAGAVAEALPASFTDPARLLPALGHMVGERRIQVWSRHGAEQRRLARTPAAGVLPQRPGPFAALVVNNSAGGKLDYYLERSVDYRLGPCRDGRRTTNVRIRLTNAVPRGDLPSYVTGRLDSPKRPHVPGSNLLWVSLYGGMGATLTEARLDGKPVPVMRETERSRPVYSALLEFAPRQSRTLELDLVEPASAQPPLVPVQPLVRPQRTRITEDRGGCPVPVRPAGVP
ncbi:hypothetical protein FHS43_002915 [Streptosporangium becharense]|uniref:DUF4012 domain-containing protein n=1 Tax=Streptosporangium becharense TaxID=1816182 RepID=A0A7W9IKR5_9ACTN|nr:DUF4012 domain-containing protein [Streptosporangium becharense]MBB2911642.1 hypothetical protein [Streptosporangium becharense]MBB5822540.1 hypothetical protein [Streptosporangium becharense]